MGYVLAIDQGTTGSTALILDEGLRCRGRHDCDFAQHFPAPGLVEHDPEEIWASVRTAVAGALAAAGIDGHQLRAIGLTNQRETTLLWERKTGNPLHRAIVWQDRRTAAQCAQLQRDGHAAAVRRRTGLPIDPYFCATKIQWLLTATNSTTRAERGELAFGTIDCFLLHRLTGGVVHATEPTNAARSLLFDLQTMAWSDELCALFGVPPALLPVVQPSVGQFGLTRGCGFLPDGIPITGIAGDQQAALFGQACLTRGDAKCTFGTGAFLLRNTGEQPVPSSHGLVTTVAWQRDGRTTYALEGSAFLAGAAVQWLCQGIGLCQDPAEVEALAASVPDTGGVVFVPAFTGLGAPHWRPDARGCFLGLSRGTTRAHLARAVLEGIALQNMDLLLAVEGDTGMPLQQLKVDGGAAANDLLLQFQADVLGADILRPTQLEATGFGAACLAGIGAGMFSDAEVAAAWQLQARFAPQIDDNARTEHRARWTAAIDRA